MDAEILNQIQHRLDGLNERHQALRGYLDFDVKKLRLDQISKELEDPSIWNDQGRSQTLGKEKRELDFIVNGLSNLASNLKDQCDLFELARNENDDETLKVVLDESHSLEKSVEAMEFRRMFSHPMDPNNCFINFQSGSGGTEAQDWANMLLRMYIRYGERKGFKVEVLDISDGDIAGIKSATLKISGDYAFGHLRTETGVHRLVRKSPFDSGNRRHTSFASVQVYPEVDDSIEVDINPADLRIDTYRASGAGGQHINKTDSAVRITHIPTNTVVQCQDDRSQHRNRAEAMNMLRAQLYALELNKRNEEKQALEDAKTDIGWGHQIRSYVLDQSRIKDLRTNVEVGNTQGVLDGDLDPFISESLKQGV
ncbi:peptide chain release factor 2 [Candidatus Methylopumilus planktonicus]|uniref:peptide chain release factor 2 n=1 Tax=Candidatus Methylopumilus planktonicus TaxID=1581557 RepID=UPI0011229F1C|nr:peptide chain release factor 2 [Candidatus Methylopumilus planktonicus]QDD11148.1 peptide chain release factor 2 [Candidatus Methylopumilus planktonicus]QDD23618.1 peptide chain release factor 2 [Candidatus Methylopumilus planktonicus]